MGHSGDRYAEGVLSDVRFLADSSNRSHVLHRLDRGDATHAELQDATGASRVTISRILAGCTERGWVVEQDHEFHLTMLGERVLDAYDQLCDALETVQSISPIWGDLPIEKFDFDPVVLHDADLLFPDRSDPFRTVRALSRDVATASNVTLLSATLYSEGLRETVSAIEERDHTFEAVLAADLLARIREDESLREMLQQLRDLPSTTIFAHEGPLPDYIVGVADGVGILHVFDGDGHPRVLIRSPQTEFVDWCTREYEAYRHEASPYDD